MARSPFPTSPSHSSSAARTFRRAALVVGGSVLLVVAVLAVLIAGPGAGPFGPPGDEGGGPGSGRVVRVVDGDTLVADIDGTQESVRLIGIDTPETVAPNRPVECYGAEASHRLGELLPPGTAIRLERDVEPRDPYDRLLAYVYRSDDGLLVNLAQVEGGFAEAKEYPPNTAWKAELDGVEQTARAAGAGLWGACGGADTPVPSRPSGGRSPGG
jgi:micrococcal nuclease